MASLAVDAAFRARLAANWTATPVLPMNIGGDTPQGVDAFLVIQYPVSVATKPVLQRTYWEEGVARLILNTISGMGGEYGQGLADQLATLFRDVKFDGVQTFWPEPPVVNDANDDGQWFEFAVNVPYRFEFDG